MGTGGQCHAPADLLPAKRAGTHYTRDWAGPRSGIDGCAKYRPPLAFDDPRTMKPVASRYTDNAVLAPVH